MATSPARGRRPSAEEVDSTLDASRALLGVVARSVAGALEQVTLPQFRVLVLLSVDGPLRSGVLAERAGVHPSTFSRTADRLVAGGWVRRVENPHSRREVIVAPTTAGRRLVADVTRRRREEIARILGRLSPGERESVRAGLTAFALGAGEVSVDDLAALGG
ncbi:MAG TPA: MarR family transcriptional regulator [Actinomycetes bacterium]|jgi:DNA-binding MarR family transcriptional regulator|nr:MarR family transcriptional regulator [Actinomycetes bacterium]